MASSSQILWAGEAPHAHRDVLAATCVVTVAGSYADAVNSVNEGDFDAAIIDAKALGEDAFALLRHVRSRASRRYLPLLFWSSGSALADRVKAFEAGADDFVEASAAPAELQARVAHHLALRSRIDVLLHETERLYELSLTDAQTQVANHRHFQERLRDEFRRAQRYDDPLALILLDLDHFKQVNDRYGHLVGDEVLKAVAVAIKKSVRETDFVARYGGEEFAIVLPKTQLAGALTVAERVWHDVASLRCGDTGEVRITASLGMSGFPSRAVTTAEQLVRCADDALYRAKREGRNKIAIFQP